MATVLSRFGALLTTYPFSLSILFRVNERTANQFILMHLSSLPYFLSFFLSYLFPSSPQTRIPQRNPHQQWLHHEPRLRTFFFFLLTPSPPRAISSPPATKTARSRFSTSPNCACCTLCTVRFAFLFVLTSQTTRCPFARSFSPRPSSSTRAATTEASRVMTAERRASRWSIRCRDTQGS